MICLLVELMLSLMNQPDNNPNPTQMYYTVSIQMHHICDCSYNRS